MGEGPVLLLLHGLFGALSNFEDVINGFSGKHKVIVPLMPLYDLPLKKTSEEDLASQLLELLQDLVPVSAPVVVGDGPG